MSELYISELQSKAVISIESGINYGHIVDVEIKPDGTVVGFICQSRNILKKNFKNGEVSFKFGDIEKIGKDVILVRI